MSSIWQIYGIKRAGAMAIAVALTRLRDQASLLARIILGRSESLILSLSCQLCLYGLRLSSGCCFAES
jgi:hypothetical protein